MTGIVCLNKPKGITSFVAVAKVRALFGEKKAGHTGTLDPMATGVLPILLGGATRFIPLLPTNKKAYTAKFRLGLTTDTLDITGTVTGEYPVTAGIEEVRQALTYFRGEIEQVPPMYSAILKDGVRLYELARKGIEVERESRRVSIDSLGLVGFDAANHEYEIAVECSAGTYIRTLISDIGQRLGCGAVMTKLCRTKANGFALSACYTLEQLEQMKEEGILQSALMTVEETFSELEPVEVSPAQAKRFSNGGALLIDRLKESKGEGLYRVYSPEQTFLGLGEIEPEGLELKVKRLLVEQEKK